MIHHPVPGKVWSSEDRVVLKFGAVEFKLTLDEVTDHLLAVGEAWREAYDWEPPEPYDPFEIDDTRAVEDRG